MASVLVFNVLSRLQCSGFRLPSCNGMHMDQIPPPQSPRGWSRLDSCDPVNWLPLNTSQLMGCTWKSHPQTSVPNPKRLWFTLCLWHQTAACAASLSHLQSWGWLRALGGVGFPQNPPAEAVKKRNIWSFYL